MVRYLILLVLLLYGCGGEPVIPERDSPEAGVYLQRCSGCHPPPEPSKYTFERWRDLLGLMEMQMARKGLPPLSKEERAMILDYLRRHSQEEGA